MAQSSRTRRRRSQRHSRRHLHQPMTLAAKASDAITTFAGSWAFVLIHVVWFGLWLPLRLDINLLTLIVSLEAIFLATFVMMSQNRSASIDRARDDHEAKEVDELATLNQTQLDILLLLKEVQSPRKEK